MELKNKKHIKESNEGYEIQFTPFIIIKFIPLYDENEIEIDFINKEDNYLLGDFEVPVNSINWFDDEEVTDLIAKEIVIEVLSNYIYHYKDYWEVMSDVCLLVKLLANAFQDLFKNSSNFSQCVIDLFDLKKIEDETINEDFEFYKTKSGKTEVDKVSIGASKSGKSFNDGSTNKGDTSNAVKRIPVSQMKKDDKDLVRDVCYTLNKNGDIKHLNKKFNVNPKPDVVMKGDGEHMDIYYDDNVTGEPDKKNVKIQSNPKKIKETKVKNYKTDFDSWGDTFYLTYTSLDSNWWISLELNKEDITVKAEYEPGEWDGSEAGGLPGGWLSYPGYYIDDIDTSAVEVSDIKYYIGDDNDDELTLEEFKEGTGLSDVEVKKYVKEAEDIFADEIEEYVDNHEDEFIQED